MVIKIKDFENLYTIDVNGNVYSLIKKIILKPILTRGYKSVRLCNNKKQKSITIHRLLALHFIDNPENKLQINHKDGNKLNNNLSNLEWCTPSENALHAYKLGLSKYTKSIKRNKNISLKNRSKLNEKREEILNLYKEGKLMKEIASLYGTTRQTISVVLKGVYKF